MSSKKTSSTADLCLSLYFSTSASISRTSRTISSGVAWKWHEGAPNTVVSVASAFTVEHLIQETTRKCKWLLIVLKCWWILWIVVLSLWSRSVLYVVFLTFWRMVLHLPRKSEKTKQNKKKWNVDHCFKLMCLLLFGSRLNEQQFLNIQLNRRGAEWLTLTLNKRLDVQWTWFCLLLANYYHAPV